MRPRHLALLVSLGFIWGASFLFIKVALMGGIPPFTIVAGRVGIAGLVLLTILAWRREPLLPTGTGPVTYLLLGLFNGAIPYSLISWGEVRIDAGLAAIFNGTMPIFTIVLAHFTTSDEKMSAGKVAGVALGVLGVFFLVGPAALGGASSSLAGQLAVMGASVSYAVAAIYGKRLSSVPSMTLAAGQMAGGTLLILPLALTVDRPWTLSPSSPAVLSVLALALLGTALAYLIYFHLLAATGATNTSLVTFIIPVSGVILGVVVLGERPAPSSLLGLILIMSGVWAVTGGAARPSSAAVFDPVRWAETYLPAGAVERIINLTMTVVCLLFLARRAAEYGDFTLKPLWAVETAIFLVLAGAYLFRHKAVDRSRGAAEIVVPLAGALLPFALLGTAPTVRIAASRGAMMAVFWAMTASTAFTAWGMWALRRSFSITVEARQLVDKGPYRWLRHPIYAGEVATAAVVAVWRFSLFNLAVLALFAAVQLYRAHLEEKKLAVNFPDYEEYKKGSWWVWR